MKINKYYVYCHCFTDTNEVFYVGKGCGNRLNSKNRSESWKGIKGNRPFYSIKVREFTDEKEALDFEYELLTELTPKGNSNLTKSRIKVIDFEVIN